jgi:enoyl-CoA hydratase/carnithine racemase
MITEFIHFKIQNNTGIIKLNRPDVLNALNFDMTITLLNILKDCKKRESIKRILLIGEGKSLCAGGDVKSLFLSSKKNDLKEKFFQKEYLLNNFINEFPKNYLSVWNGIVMGGGVGLSIYGNYRLATENAKFAMPETAIGFFPDVGGSYFLSKLKNGIGLYLGLTGKICNARDMMDLGLATNYIPSKYLSVTIDKYTKTGTLNTSNYYPKMKSEIQENKNFIQDVFQYDLNKITEKLKNSKTKFGQKIYSHLLTRCPMSLAVSLKLINNVKLKTLSECLQIEYQLSQHMVYRNDFNNGVDSVLISKNHLPKWNPSTIDKINYDEVENMFVSNKKTLYL